MRIPALALLLLTTAALAQDEAPAAAAKPNAKDLQARPAEMARLASKNLLLGIAAAGDALVAVGDRGVILRSTDGAKWDQVASPVHATLTAVSFADAKAGWAVGHDATILHTADGGANWRLQNFTPAEAKPLLTVLALDAQRAIALGAYGLALATADGGATWAPLDSPVLVEEGRHLNALARLGNGDVFLAGETGLLAVSADGTEWKRVALPYEGSLFGALPRGERGAIVFGLRGNAYVSDDVRAGKWAKVDTQTVQSLFGGTVLADGDALLVGADGETLRVDAAGTAKRVSAQSHAGTLSGVLARGDGLVVIGEYGVGTLRP
ncbi:MAG TPA: YCF48-related protein [Verrucomicrobiae bacterium]|nr:YCF48-related protein [Verrucomicrobiae bacterium]